MKCHFVLYFVRFKNVELVNLNVIATGRFKIFLRNYSDQTNLQGAKVDWDFRISDLVKNPDGTDI